MEKEQLILEVQDDIARWRSEGTRFGIARVVLIEGSGPRNPGATMAVSEDGRVAGSVSGGCVEGAVVTESLDLMSSGDSKLVRFGYSDDEAFAVGLTCGGVITIFCSPELPAVYDELVDAAANGRPCVLATVIATDSVESSVHLDGHELDSGCVSIDRNLSEIVDLGATVLVYGDGSRVGSFGDRSLDQLITRDGLGVISSGGSVIRHYGIMGQAVGDELSIFYESFAPPPKMLIFGAVDFTTALTRVAKVLGYEVTVCDARAPFATKARFPQADYVVVDWPHRYLESVKELLGPSDAVCVLTHDPKFDVPAIIGALETKVGYIGAMGSRTTHADRSRRLSEAGVDDQQLAKVMAPIGLDIGARTPEETAVAICAEIIALQTGHPTGFLRDANGPIHTEQATYAERVDREW